MELIKIKNIFVEKIKIQMKTLLTIIKINCILIFVLTFVGFYTYFPWSKSFLTFLEGILFLTLWIIPIAHNIYCCELNKKNINRFKDDLIFYRIPRITISSLKFRKILGLISFLLLIYQTVGFWQFIFTMIDPEFEFYKIALFGSFLIFPTFLLILIILLNALYQWFNGSSKEKQIS